MAANGDLPPEIVDDWDQYRVVLPPELRSYIEGWHYWYTIIVHSGVHVRPYVAAEYMHQHMSKETRPAPFPLNIEETWYCGLLILLIVGGHIGADEGWLFEKVYPQAQWVGRVAGRVLLTLGAAVLSTFSFEVAGGILIKKFNDAGAWIREGVSLSVTRNTELQVYLYDTFEGMAVMLFDFLAFSFVNTGNRLIEPCVEKIISPALYFFFSIPVNFIPTALKWLFLPTPGLDEVQDLRTLWFEYGVPIVIQFWLTVLLWLLWILYMAKAERLALQGWRAVDPKLTLTWQLIRATAAHLIAYTAYQLVCGSIAGIRSALPTGSDHLTILDGPIVPFLGKVIPEGNIVAAVMLLFTHWLLRAAGLLAVRLSRFFWIPFILWQTQYSQYGAEAYWGSFVEFLMHDSTTPQARKRVTSRALMTAIFGLKSSWPARFNLSSVVPDD